MAADALRWILGGTVGRERVISPERRILGLSLPLDVDPDVDGNGLLDSLRLRLGRSMPLLLDRTKPSISTDSASSVSEGLNGGIRLSAVVDGVGDSGVEGESDVLPLPLAGGVVDNVLVVKVEVLDESDPLGVRVVTVGRAVAVSCFSSGIRDSLVNWEGLLLSTTNMTASHL